MNLDVDINASLATSMITGLFPGPPGAGRGHPFELRAGPWFGGELQVISLRGRERINDVYRYDVVFATDQAPELVTSALFGMPACLTIKSPGHDPRVIQGLAVSIEALGGVAGEQGSKRRRFSLSIVPRLWLLKHSRRNRIFQNKTVPEIVKTILAGIEIEDSDCHWRANKPAYPRLPFVYQRGETDWDFFRRVLASAGIFFFYEHASGFLDSLFGPAASAVAGAVGAAAGMLGGAIGSAVGTVESATGMVPVLNFGDAAGHTAAVASGLGGVAADALQAGLGALGGALGGAAGAAVSAVAGAVEEPSDTIAFDDDQGADADFNRVYEFGARKTLRTKELRMLDRDVEAARSWVGVASVADASASLNLSVGVQMAGGLSGGGLSGALSAGAGVGAGLDVDAPTIPAKMLRQEIYQEDLAVWHDATGAHAEPAVALSASLAPGGVGVAASAQAGASPYLRDAATARRLHMELERTRRKYEEAHGRSDCRRMGAGYRFSLGGHPIKMVNGEYTITALDVVGVHPDFLEDGAAVYRNRFRCIPSSVAPRPKRPKRRPKPGMEVARVVGFIGGDALPGLEANPAGYVRVRFRWDIIDDDRATPRGSLEIGATETNDVHSVWLPVVQPWAGNGYGTQFIPREGMEVLVGFMEDQSERPIILGCLYSEESRPPWPEYIDHQKVGIRSRTRPANGGWSELSIDDRQGGEVVQFRAQRDMREDVLNDRLTAISRDRTTTIGRDSRLSVIQDRSVSVGHDQTHTVGGSDSRTVTGSVTHDLRSHVSLSVRGTTTETLSGDYHRTLDANAQVDTQGETHLNFKGDYTERHTGHRTVVVGAGGAHRSATLHVEGTGRMYASKAIEVESLEGLSILCGKSQLLISPNGITLSTPTLTLTGKEVEVRAGKVTVASTGDLTLGGSTATVRTSGAKMTLDSSTASLIGAQVKLGGGSGTAVQTETSSVIVTKVQMKDPQGKPRANARVLLTKGGKTGEQRMTVLDENGMLELIGDAAYQVSFPDDTPAEMNDPMQPYVIRQGDYLAQLAYSLGFDAQAVWGDDKNAALRELRPDPNILLPGDILYVPDQPANGNPSRDLATGTTNTFSADVPTVPVTIKFSEARFASKPCSIAELEKLTDLATDPSGALTFAVPVTLPVVTIVFSDPPYVCACAVGNLDPIETVSGVFQRLQNLGYIDHALTFDATNLGLIRGGLRVLREDASAKAGGSDDTPTTADATTNDAPPSTPQGEAQTPQADDVPSDQPVPDDGVADDETVADDARKLLLAAHGS